MPVTRRVPRISPRVALVAILLMAALLRVNWFVGLVSGDPQDDGVYYRNAFALYKEGPTYLDRFRSLPVDFLANPIDLFDVRPMVTYPIAAAFAVFGPGEVAATVWGFLCSMLNVLVVYRLGCRTHNRSVGLVAAFLCAFYPLEVINATRILSDVQVGLFSAAGLLLFVEGFARRSLLLNVFAGMAAAGAYLANARGLIFLVALVGCAAVQALLRKASWKVPVLVLTGFAIVFSAEAVVYYLRTGDPLLNYHIHAGSSYFKYLHEPVSGFRWGWLEVSYTNGEPFELARSVLLLANRPTNQFGLFFFVFFAATLFSVATRRNLLLLAIAVGLSLYLEFGPVRLSIDWPHREVHYMMVFKQERFLLQLTAPFVVLAAYSLRALRSRSRIAAAVVVVALFATSIAAIARTHQHYRSGLNDLRSTAELVHSNSDRVFFGDFWAIEHLKIFTHYTADNLRVLNPQTSPHELAGSCVMLGGSRGVELLSGYVETTLPSFAREILARDAAPTEWMLVKRIHGPRNPQRLHDFRVYCVP